MAKASGLSVQSIRNYEQWGFLPESQRSSAGYRRYEQRHLHALTVSRMMIRAFGWERSRGIMSSLHRGELAPALAALDAYHAVLHRERQEVERSLEVLRNTSLRELASSHNEQQEAISFSKKHSFRIGEVAQQVGVRVSAVRFWEEQGLVKPSRERESRYRSYDAEQVRNVRIVVLLRKVGYNFETIRMVLAQLTTGSPEQALAAAEQRLAELQERSRACMEATATLWEYIKNTRLV